MNAHEFRGSQGCWTNMTNWIDEKLHDFFGRLGFYCATNPVKVLVIGFLVTIGLGCGLNFYQITTDPVELWSSPTSQARQEKAYFDENFGKFFRSEQMIISIDQIVAQAPNTTAMNVTDLGHSRAPYSTSTDPDKQPDSVHYGAMFNKQVLHRLIDLQLAVRNLSTADGITLQDICLQPLKPVNTNCTIMSVTGYFQNSHENLDKQMTDDFFGDILADYHDHLVSCTRTPTDIMDSGLNGLHMPCLAEFGGPINPNVAIGSFDGKNYMNGTHAVVSIPVLNDPETAKKAIKWEKVFLDHIQHFLANDSLLNITDLNQSGEKGKSDWAQVKFKVAYMSERSVEDEIERESGTDVTTVLFSYVVMFCYVSFALGQFSSFSRIFIDSKVTHFNHLNSPNQTFRLRSALSAWPL